MYNCYLADSNKLMAVRLISATWAQKTFDFYSLDIMFIDLIKNFHLADPSEVMAVSLISASWAQKRLTPTF